MLQLVRTQTDERETDTPSVDPAALLLSRRSAATKAAYSGALRAFFGESYAEADVRSFVSLPPTTIAQRLHEFKADMISDKLSEATINQRLAAIRSLLKLSHTLGLSQTTGAGLVQAEKVRGYRDTRGISLLLMKKLLELPGTDDVKGLRDTFLLRLAFENGLRRMEISALDVADLQLRERRLQIRGKGRGTQREFVDVSPRLIAAARAYLKASGHQDGPLFRNVSPNHAGRGTDGRLTPAGVYYVVAYYGRQMGLVLSPHRLRHTAITQAAKEVRGDLTALLEFSRHKDIKTAQIYVDNVQAAQRKITNKLSRKV